MATFLDPTKHKTPLGTYPEVSVEGWPAPHLIARDRDQIGEAIVSFISKWRGHPKLADGPWDPRVGAINLVAPDQPRPDTDPIPRYRLKEDAFLGPNLYSAGQELDYPFWPVRPSTLEPMNQSAERVLDYMARIAPGRTLPGSPHERGVLNLPSPALLFGTPQNYTHRGTFGNPSFAA